MNTSEAFLVAMVGVFSLPYLVWRLARTDAWAPQVVVQILAFTALLLMAVGSTMLTIPMATPLLARLRAGPRHQPACAGAEAVRVATA